jgi:hypothetical protein
MQQLTPDPAHNPPTHPPITTTTYSTFNHNHITGARAAYQLACEFVAATNLTYGWTSQKLSELGGSEKARLPDMFAADYEWSQKVGWVDTSFFLLSPVAPSLGLSFSLWSHKGGSMSSSACASLGCSL